MPDLWDEYKRNLEAIEREFPEARCLNKTQMTYYLGLTKRQSLRQFGITGKLTRESFAMRLVKGKEAE